MIFMEFEIENGVLVGYRGEEEHVVIPDGVSKIADQVFKDCTAASTAPHALMLVNRGISLVISILSLMSIVGTGS